MEEKIQNFIEQNWFKVGILAALFIIAFSVFYYFMVFIPEKELMIINQQKQKEEEVKIQNAQATIFDNKIKCNNLYDTLRKQFNNVAAVYYSEQLNTCMVKYFKNGQTEETTIENFQEIK